MDSESLILEIFVSEIYKTLTPANPVATMTDRQENRNVLPRGCVRKLNYTFTPDKMADEMIQLTNQV